MTDPKACFIYSITEAQFLFGASTLSIDVTVMAVKAALLWYTNIIPPLIIKAIHWCLSSTSFTSFVSLQMSLMHEEYLLQSCLWISASAAQSDITINTGGGGVDGKQRLMARQGHIYCFFTQGGKVQVTLAYTDYLSHLGGLSLNRALAFVLQW